MQKIFRTLIQSLFLISLLHLSACSLFTRTREGYQNHEEDESAYTSNSTPEEAYVDNEIARMQAKIRELESKINRLNRVLEIDKKESMLRSQAEHSPAKITALPAKTIEQQQQDSPFADPRKESMPVEQDQVVIDKFKVAMREFQSGNNDSASVSFGTIAAIHPNHPFAAHAKYWSGEAYARNKQWKFAIQQWEELKSKYPRSIYIPETLAGLTRVYAAAGDQIQSQKHKKLLINSFPEAPATLNFMADDSVNNLVR